MLVSLEYAYATIMLLAFYSILSSTNLCQSDFRVQKSLELTMRAVSDVWGLSKIKAVADSESQHWTILTASNAVQPTSIEYK